MTRLRDRGRFAIVFSALVATSPGPAHAVAVALQAARPAVEWETILRADGVDFDLHAAALAAGGDGVWIGGRIGNYRNDTAELRHVDARGQEVRRVDLRGVFENDQILGLAATTTGRVVATNLDRHGSALVVIDADRGAVVAQRRVDLHRDLNVLSATAMSDGRVLLTGTCSDGGWYAAIDDAGNILWEKLLPATTAATVLSAAPAADGYVLVGSALSTPADPITWVGRIDSRGTVLAERRLPVFSETLSTSADGSTLLLGLEPAGSMRTDLWTRLLGATLVESRAHTIAAPDVPIVPRPRAAALDRRSWLILAGDKAHLPTLTAIDTEGRSLWSDVRPFDRATVPMVTAVWAAARPGSLYAVFSLAALVAPSGPHLVSTHVLKLRATAE